MFNDGLLVAFISKPILNAKLLNKPPSLTTVSFDMAIETFKSAGITKGITTELELTLKMYLGLSLRNCSLINVPSIAQR